MTIGGNKIAPWIADRYLTRTAYSSQQTQEPVEPNRPDNLFQPVPGDRGAHGKFDDQAYVSDRQFWAVKHRGWLALAGAGLAGAAYVLSRRSR